MRKPHLLRSFEIYGRHGRWTVDAHILVAFPADCLTVTLRHRLRVHAPGLTPRAVLEKLAGIQMLDVTFPTTDGRRLVMPRAEPSQLGRSDPGMCIVFNKGTAKVSTTF